MNETAGMTLNHSVSKPSYLSCRLPAFSRLFSWSTHDFSREFVRRIELGIEHWPLLQTVDSDD